MAKKKKEVLIETEDSQEVEINEIDTTDEEEITAEGNIETEDSQDAGENRVYKSLQQGVMSLPIFVKDKSGNEVKRYARFNKNTLRTSDPQEIAELDRIYEEDRNLPVKNRRILSEDEFLSVTSPDSLYVEVEGEKIHISQIREAVKIARTNGWTPSETEVIIINENKSKIIRGGTSAGIGGI